MKNNTNEEFNIELQEFSDEAMNAICGGENAGEEESINDGRQAGCFGLAGCCIDIRIRI